MQLGRIENEPHAVYFGDSDKPAFGGSAIKLWITDPELFYHQYVKKDVPKPDGNSAAFAVGNEVDASLTKRERARVVSEFKTLTSQGFAKDIADNPDANVLTPAEAELSDELTATALDHPTLGRICNSFTPQVTYRVNMGPFYLQSRIDLEASNDDIPEAVFDALRLPIESTDRCLVDIKTCASHLGQYAFKRMAMRSPMLYPIQQALYQLVAGKVLGLDESQLPFRFAVIAKDGTGVKFYDLNDLYDTANNKVVAAVGELVHRYESNQWGDFEQECETVFIAEEWLKWAE